MEEFGNDEMCPKCRLNCVHLGLLSDSELSDLNKHKKEVTFNKGETLYKQNTFISNIIFIQEGLVKLMIEGQGGKNYALRIYGTQEYLGLTQIFGQRISNFTAIVLKKTKVCMIEISLFERMLFKRSALSKSILKLCADENNFIFKRLAILSTNNIQGRLSDTLMYLAGESLARENIYSYVTRKDLAELSGISLESLVRLIKDFKRDKIIEQTRKHIEIKRPDILKILCKAG